MTNKAYKLEFANRLRDLMIQRGFASHHAASGASPSALCKAIGCFNEMALRYLDGRSIPNPETLLKISEWLQVEPGYLLFGEQAYKLLVQEDERFITVNKDFLHYTLTQIALVLKEMKESDEREFVDFYLSVLIELSNMDIHDDDLKKVFDLTMKSVLKSKDNGTSRSKPACKATS